MRRGLWKCLGTGKCVYIEEISGGVKFVIGHVKPANEIQSSKLILEKLNRSGTEKIVKGNFEYFFEYYNNLPMRKLL